MDPHRNIFYYYRGPTKQELGKISVDKQLENNTTKALINLLSYSSEKALPVFLRLVESKLGLQALTSKQTHEYRFALQSIPEICKGCDRRILLSICRDPSVQSKDGKGGKPDAWIYIPSSLAIMIETKLEGRPSEAQIQGHLREAAWDGNKVDRCNLSWSEIYESLASEQGFLISQFRQYLEVIRMAPFSGFVDDDFSFFLSCDDDYRQTIRSKLEEFGHLVIKNMPTEMRAKYGNLTVPPIKKERQEASVDFRKSKSDTGPFKNCNLCMPIDSEKLQCVAVIQGGKCGDSKGAMHHLYSKMASEPGKLKSLLTALGNGYYVEIFNRVPLHGNNPGRGNDKWESKAKFQLDYVSDEMVAYILRMLKDVSLPGLQIGREFGRNDPTLRDKKVLIETVCGIFKNVYPILRYLEQ